jgi:phospholipase C
MDQTARHFGALRLPNLIEARKALNLLTSDCWCGGLLQWLARRYKIKATDTTGYSLSPTQTGAFRDLPQPNTTLNAFPAPPCVVSRFLTERGENPSGIQFCSDPGLTASSQGLLSTGGTGQSFYAPELKPTVLPVPDCRYSSTLEDGPFPLVAASSLNECGPPFLDLVPAIVPTRFSDNTGGPVHRFFQMWQQNDCAGANTTEENPSGCNHDLYAWVATSVGLQMTKAPSVVVRRRGNSEHHGVRGQATRQGQRK